MRYRSAFRYTICGLHVFTTNVHMLFVIHPLRKYEGTPRIVLVFCINTVQVNF